MVKAMGYFDDAIAEREESLEHDGFSGSDIIELSEEEYLEHGRFGSFRKDHKYIDRIWKGGKWVYRYAKKAAGKVSDTVNKNITGQYYKDRFLQKEDESLEDLEKMDEGNKKGDKEWNYEIHSRGYQKFAHDEQARDNAERNYYTKSLAGKIESKRHGGRTDMLDPLQLRAEKDKKKKLKHDDESGDEIRYFPVRDEEYLEHHGVLGQKWGIRRFQNKDGSLTAEGKKRAAEGTEGVRKVLEKGQSQVIRKRTFGKIKAGASALGTIAGTTAAGAAIGSSGGPIGTLAGGYTGFIAGVPTSMAVSYFVKKHADVKANALEDQYRMLGQKMMEENKNIKLSDIDKDLSNSKKKNAGAIDDANSRLNRQMQIENQINNQNLINDQIRIANQMSQQAATQAMNAGLMTASLGVSGGTNPYMFGQM